MCSRLSPFIRQADLETFQRKQVHRMAPSATVLVVWRILERHRWLSSRHFQDVRWFGSEGPPTPDSLPHMENSARTLSRRGSSGAVIVLNVLRIYEASTQGREYNSCSSMTAVAQTWAAAWGTAEGAGNIRGWRCRVQGRRLDAFSRGKHAVGDSWSVVPTRECRGILRPGSEKTRHALEALGLGCGWTSESKGLSHSWIVS